MKVAVGDKLVVHPGNKGFVAICTLHVRFLDGNMRIYRDGDIFLLDTSEMHCPSEELEPDGCTQSHIILEVKQD